MQLVTFTAPAYWASYLINGDASGLDPDQGETPEAIDAAITAYLEPGWSILSCGDDSEDGGSFFSWSCDVSLSGLGGDMIEYTANVAWDPAEYASYKENHRLIYGGQHD